MQTFVENKFFLMSRGGASLGLGGLKPPKIKLSLANIMIHFVLYSSGSQTGVLMSFVTL